MSTKDKGNACHIENNTIRFKKNHIQFKTQEICRIKHLSMNSLIIRSDWNNMIWDQKNAAILLPDLPRMYKAWAFADLRKQNLK